ncbi:hypothetical protein [Bradyrhizobium sp. SZCCHNS1012]|uniref:DUF7940 domain-containing protein n=1 Tax=Bradyrhizobium sp. SZCCHNS1012 TaxID=3057297 RepID=UPI0029166DF1|nr:hypothetical protein [Bradyrhizobium sp. SZCCHNS1012]
MKKPTLIPNWKQAHRFHTVRLAAFWGVLNGGVLALAKFSDILDPWTFLALNCVGYGLIAVGRVMKQPGID